MQKQNELKISSDSVGEWQSISDSGQAHLSKQKIFDPSTARKARK